MADRPHVVLVLGMHRSGTSAITRVLNLLGLQLPGQLMPPAEDNNETGFWESERLAEIHDRLLAEIGSAWDDCLSLPAGLESSAIARPFADEILQVLEEDFDRVTPIVIKDPRLCRLVPLWRGILRDFGAQCHPVLIARHPLEVAASLARRDHFPTDRSLHLWLRHVVDAERDTRDVPRSIITYAGLLADWRRTVGKLEAELGFAWPRHRDAAESEIDAFLTTSLRHHRSEPAERIGQARLHRWAGDVYASFERAMQGESLPEERFDEIGEALQAAEAVFAPAMAVMQSSLTENLDAIEQRLGKEMQRAEQRKLEALQAAHELDKEKYESVVAEVTAAHERNQAIYEAEITKIQDRAETHLAKLETALTNNQEQLETTRRELEDTRRDKDWLWRVKTELEAPQRSKVGRLIWRQWTLYLATRQKVIGARAKADRSSSLVGSAVSLLGSAGRALLKPVTRTGGRLFLLGNAGWEQAMAASRGALRASPAQPTASTARVPPLRRPRVLLVSPYPISPPHHGGGVRLMNLIQRLADECELHLLVFSPDEDNDRQRAALEPWARSVHFHHWQPQFDPGWWHLQPPNAGLFYSDEAARQIAHLLATLRIEILQLEYAELGQYGMPRFANVKVVLTEHDLAFRQHRRRRKMGFHQRFPEGNAYGATFGDWLRLLRYELAVCRRADQIHVMSEHDGEDLSRFLRDSWERIRVVPNAVDTAYYDPEGTAADREGVLYVGNFQNLPNVDALEYLVEEIWPTVRSRSRNTRLTVVGAHPSDRVTRFHARDGIEVVGEVPDLRPYYHGHQLMVAPIRAGSGTRLKILEAFAAGIPVVSTRIGAEGIAGVHREHLLIADQPQAFASAVVDLLDSAELGTRLADQALDLARGSYDWQHSAEATLRGWDDLLTRDPGRDRSSPLPAEETSRAPSEKGSVDVSIIIPTFHGGEDLARCLASIARQKTDLAVEVVCVDSAGDDSDAVTMQQHGVHVIAIDPAEFDHGLTRDLGAAQSHGAILVFLNQDAVPVDDQWLSRLTQPLLEDDHCAAVQGGISESPDPAERFFWDSCGDRFYFTRESDRWIERYFGIGFSTVNAAIRRRVWQEYPFGAAPIMEDKKWQQRVVDDGQVIRCEPQAAVIHTHNYELRSLWRRCLSEGFGWRLLGERYSALDMMRDGLQLRVHRDLMQGLAKGRIRSSAELLFPWLRPFALYWGNHWSRSVKL